LRGVLKKETRDIILGVRFVVIAIETYFNPFRIHLSKKEPVSLAVSLKNNGNESKKVSLEVLLTRQFSFDKEGFKNTELKRIDELKAGEQKKFYFDIYPKQMTRIGLHPVVVRVLEHYNNYTYVLKEYKKKLELKVEQ
jgi:uncharacterized membrane protein